jgi:hypothetical protein
VAIGVSPLWDLNAGLDIGVCLREFRRSKWESGMTEQSEPKKNKWIMWGWIALAAIVGAVAIDGLLEPDEVAAGEVISGELAEEARVKESDNWPDGFEYTLTRKGDETDTVILFFDASQRSVRNEGDSVNRFANDLLGLIKDQQRRISEGTTEARNFIVYYTGATSDQYGNTASAKFFGFVINAETVAKLNTKTNNQWALLNLVAIEESKTIGKRELAAWCQNDNAQYTRRFCQTVRIHLN